jgi:hypothetical protein
LIGVWIDLPNATLTVANINFDRRTIKRGKRTMLLASRVIGRGQ